jgi:hypothetical protein
MFEQKLRPSKPKKASKRHSLAFYVIGTFTFAIEFMLGVNAAFLVDQSVRIVTENMLTGTPIAPLAGAITLIASLAVGFCFVFGGMWVFGGFMDSLADAEAYEDENGTNAWPRVMVWLLFLAVIALDFTTLLFRAAYFAEKGASALFAFFVILLLMPPVLGPLIHVLENTPRGRRLNKARRQAEALEIDDVTRVVEAMDPDLRSRWLDGDATALQEHYDRVDVQRQEAYEYEQQKIRERDEKKQKSRQGLPTGKALPHPKTLTALPSQAQQSGQNHQQHRA